MRNGCCAGSGAASRFPVMSRRYSTLLKPSDSPFRPEHTIAADYEKPMPSSRKRAAARKRLTKLFVLDTNVLMHDPTSLFRFAEHDIFIPIMTLEELDNNKKGMAEGPHNPRQASRFLDDIVSPAKGDIQRGIPLSRHPADTATGRLFLQTQAINGHIPPDLPMGRADNHIIGVLMYLLKQQPQRQVILVSKDINMRIKAHALGLPAYDYFNDKVLEDTDLLYTGERELPADFWDRHGHKMESWKKEGRTWYRVHGPLCQSPMLNEFVYQQSERPLYATVKG